MEPCKSFGRLKPEKLGCMAVLACVLVPMIIMVGLPMFNSQSLDNNMSLQLPIREALVPLSTVKEIKDSHKPDIGMQILRLESEETEEESKTDVELVEMKQQHNYSRNDSKTAVFVNASNGMKQQQNYTRNDTNTAVLANAANEKKQQPDQTRNDTNTAVSVNASNEKKQQPDYTRNDNKTVELVLDSNEKKEEQNHTRYTEYFREKSQPLIVKESIEGNKSTTGEFIPQSSIICDFSGERSDTCYIHGDVRVLGKSSVILSPSSSQLSSSNVTWKIRPYARKWEANIMEQIKEITLRSSESFMENTHCDINHRAPAVVFSTGGFLGNFFHDFTDVLIPLFTTVRQYHGEVQFLATDFNSKWINKYRLILKQLSRYEIINIDTDTRVHCFQNVHVGLQSDKVMGIDPSKSPNGYSMADFRELIRESLSLERAFTKVIAAQSRRKPRLLILLRKGSRSITNAKQVIQMARRLGYKVVTAGPEETRNLTTFAHTVNSCDVMMGVHGAGLANMIFLPTNATLIQIIPWGGLKWACRHDFGEPAPDMGIRYLEYEIKEEESSLIEQYPRDHAVFTDPQSVQKQGWNALWSIFLDKQKVKLDVTRFRPVLLEALRSLKQ